VKAVSGRCRLAAGARADLVAVVAAGTAQVRAAEDRMLATRARLAALATGRPVRLAVRR
jgi:hypothetical protein